MAAVETSPEIERRRELGRRLKRNANKCYAELYATLPPTLREKVNEAVVSAVQRLTDTDGGGKAGTKIFIEARARQLILDIPPIGFGRASKRFRQAVFKKIKRSEKTLSSAPG